jgi:VanZ family protein
VNALRITPTPSLRTLCFAGFLAMTIQLLLLAEPPFAEPIISTFSDKAVHFTFFGVMALLLWITADKRWPLAVWAVVALVGVIDETHQAFVPGRTADVNDWLADGFGAATALMVARKTSPREPAGFTQIAIKDGGY